MSDRGPIVAALAALVVLLLSCAPSPGPGSAVGSTGANEVSIRVAQFGLGSATRPGDWVGVELEITDSASQPRNLILRMAVPDADGDTALHRRVIVANPGVKQSAWLYARLPFNSRAGSVYSITAHEAVDRGTGADGSVAYTPGRLLGALQYPLNQPVAPHWGMTGVVGRRIAGLDQYQANRDRSGNAPTGHEYTHIIGGLQPDRLPDRWMGLMAFETIVWTGAATDEQPTTRLSAPQAEAIREWVRRGGHFIVVIPPAGQSWIDVPGNPLADIMPEVGIRRIDGVDLHHHRQLLTRRAEVRLPNNAAIHVFVAREGVEPGAAMPILNDPDGNTIVARRLVGTGAVSLIGYDLTTRPLSDVHGALHADLLWNRILGRRLALLSAAELDEQQKGEQPLQPQQTPRPRWVSSRAEAELDGPIGTLITRSARAAAGLLLAFVVFLLYWLMAGPVGFYALKERNLKQHAWVAFLVAAGLFTAVAWGGANMLRTRKVEGQHVTFLDHVYGQSNQRIRSWFSLLLPNYGEQRIAIGDAADTDRWRHALTPWESPSGAGGAGIASFPDARPYEVDSRSPWWLEVPVRATTKSFQADWAGGTPGNWGMITPRPPEGASDALGQELRLTPDTEDQRWTLEGTLTHGLPGPLEDVSFVVVVGQTSLGAPRVGKPAFASHGNLQARAFAFAKPGGKAWLPGETLDLASVTGSDGSAAARQALDQWLQKFIPKVPGTFGGQSPNELAQRNVADSLLALSLFHVLPPPNPDETGPQTVARRSATHTWDLSRWFTQPCLIVIGHLVDDGSGAGAETPLPITVDGSPVDSTRKRIRGRTVVRWVYPFPAAPPGFNVVLPVLPGLGDGTDGSDGSDEVEQPDPGT